MAKLPAGTGPPLAGGLTYGALFVAIWASAFTAAGAVVQEWPPLWGLAIRYAAVTPILLAIVLARAARLPARADRGRLALMGLFGTAGYLGCSWVAMSLVPSGLVALLAATAPLFVALAERAWLGRRLPPLAWAGLGLGWAGVAVLGLGRAWAGLGESGVLGVGLALVGAASQAAGILAVAPAKGRLDPWVANLGQGAVALGVLLIVAALLDGPPPTRASAELLLALLYGVIVVGLVGYVLYFVMLRGLPPATAAALQLAAPPLAAVFGWALLGERLAWTDLAGGAVTLAGLALLFRARRVGG